MCGKYLLFGNGRWVNGAGLLPKGADIRNCGRKYKALARLDACERSDRHPTLAKHAALAAIQELMSSAARVDFPLLLRETAVRAQDRKAGEKMKLGGGYRIRIKEYAYEVISEIESNPDEPSRQLLLAARMGKDYGFRGHMKRAAIEAYAMGSIRFFTFGPITYATPAGLADEFQFSAEETQEGRLKTLSGILRVVTDSKLWSHFDSKKICKNFQLSAEQMRRMFVSAAADELSVVPGLTESISGQVCPLTEPFFEIYRIAKFTEAERDEFVSLAVEKCIGEDKVARARLISENYVLIEEMVGLRRNMD